MIVLAISNMNWSTGSEDSVEVLRSPSDWSFRGMRWCKPHVVDGMLYASFEGRYGFNEVEFRLLPDKARRFLIQFQKGKIDGFTLVKYSVPLDIESAKQFGLEV